MRHLPKTFGFSLLVLLFVIAACGGDDTPDDSEPNDQQPNVNTNPTPTFDPEIGPLPTPNLLSSGFDEADIPLSNEVIVKDNLTLLDLNYFVQDDRVYVMFVVRNDSSETIRNVHINVVMVDEERLPLENFDFSSPYSNIPPGQVVTIEADVFMDERWSEFYDGIAALVIADTEILEGYDAYFDADAQAQLNANGDGVTGTATNISSDPLILVTANFALFDSNGEVLAVIPATTTTGLDAEGYWQPGVTLSFDARIVVIEDNDLSAVADVQLVAAGYAIDFVDE